MGQTAAGLVVGTALGTTRALVGESIEIRKAQFYFLYGTKDRLGISGYGPRRKGELSAAQSLGAGIISL
jgi:hypothetical protein